MSELDIDAMVTGPTVQDKENKKLKAELEEANERIAEFEKALSAMNYMVKSLTNGKRSGALEQSEKLVQEFTNKFAIAQKIEALDKLVETVETSCYKHDVPIHGYQHNKAMQRTMLNIFRKAKDTMVEQLSKENELLSKG